MTHNEQTLRPIEDVVGEWRRSFGRVDLDTGAHPKYVDRQEDWLQEVLTTDRDAAYTMLREAVTKDFKVTDPDTKDHPLNELRNEIAENFLKSLDTIYGKTHTV